MAATVTGQGMAQKASAMQRECLLKGTTVIETVELYGQIQCPYTL